MKVKLWDSLLQGRARCAKIIKGEVWGVGEMDSEDEGGAHTEGDDDWVGEGLPWEAAELSGLRRQYVTSIPVRYVRPQRCEVARRKSASGQHVLDTRRPR